MLNLPKEFAFGIVQQQLVGRAAGAVRIVGFVFGSGGVGMVGPIRSCGRDDHEVRAQSGAGQQQQPQQPKQGAGVAGAPP